MVLPTINLCGVSLNQVIRCWLIRGFSSKNSLGSFTNYCLLITYHLSFTKNWTHKSSRGALSSQKPLKRGAVDLISTLMHKNFPHFTLSVPARSTSRNFPIPLPIILAFPFDKYSMGKLWACTQKKVVEKSTSQRSWFFSTLLRIRWYPSIFQGDPLFYFYQ